VHWGQCTHGRPSVRPIKAVLYAATVGQAVGRTRMAGTHHDLELQLRVRSPTTVPYHSTLMEPSGGSPHALPAVKKVGGDTVNLDIGVMVISDGTTPQLPEPPMMAGAGIGSPGGAGHGPDVSASGPATADPVVAAAGSSDDGVVPSGASASAAGASPGPSPGGGGGDGDSGSAPSMPPSPQPPRSPPKRFLPPAFSSSDPATLFGLDGDQRVLGLHPEDLTTLPSVQSQGNLDVSAVVRDLWGGGGYGAVSSLVFAALQMQALLPGACDTVCECARVCVRGTDCVG
jgi:hypothetical protein